MNSAVALLASFAFITGVVVHVRAVVTAAKPTGLDAYVLSNGLRVVLLPDPSANAVGVAVSYAIGSNDDPMGRSGLVHFLEHLAISDIDGVIPAEQFREIHAAGGSHTSVVWDNRTEFRSAAPAAYLERLLWFEAQRMTPLSRPISEARLKRIRRGIRIERARLDSRPFPYVSQRFRHAIYPASHPYREFVMGTLEQAFAASEKEIREFHRRAYAPSNAVLALTGPFAPESAKAIVGRYFGRLTAQSAVARRQIRPVVLTGNQHVEVRSRIASPTLVLFWPVNAPSAEDRPARSVLLHLLNERKIANFVMSLGGIQAEATAQSAADLNQVQSDLGRLVESYSHVSDDLDGLDRARDAQARIAESELARVDVLALELANAWLHLGASVHALRFPERIRAVTAADVRQVAQRSFGAGRVTLISMPDTKTAEPLSRISVDPQNSLVGTWQGTVKELKRTYKVEILIEKLTAGKLAGRTRYSEGADCGGALEYLGAAADGLHSFVESIDMGRGCWGGLVELRLVDAEHLQYHLRNGQAPPLAWTDPPAARLTRKSE